MALLAIGLGNFAGTTAAAPLLRRDLRVTLAVLAVVQGLLVSALLAVGSSQTAALVLIAGWGFAAGVVPVGWSTWLTRTIPDRAESGGGGILVAAIQGSMLAGAVLGGAVIHTVGVTGPLLVSGIILLLAATLTLIVLRPRTAR